MRNLNFILVLLFIVSLNFIGKLLVGFVSGRSLYEFSINLITGLTFSVLVLLLLKIKSFKRSQVLYSFVLSQGIIFYFLFTQPRLFNKILLVGFYFSGIFLVYTNKKRKDIYFVLIIIFFPLIFELSGIILFDKSFIFLNIFRNLLVLTAGYTTGLLILKN